MVNPAGPECCRKRGLMSGGVDEEVRPVEPVHLLAQLVQVLLELPFLVAPGEVGVGLLEPDLAEQVHHFRLGERLGQEQHVGSVRRTSASSQAQNSTGLVCGLSTRKIRTPCSIQNRRIRRHSW